MTKKHFEAIARTIRDEFEATLPSSDPEFIRGAAYALEETAKSLADYFARENPRFNRAQFLTACGL